MSNLNNEIKEAIMKEIQWDFVKSSGKGGQNVNKVNTAAEARWSISRNRVFDETQKGKIRSKLSGRINSNDEIVIKKNNSRSQLRNKESAIEELFNSIDKSLEKKKLRIKTKPSQASKKKRLEEKKKRSEIKNSRRNPI